MSTQKTHHNSSTQYLMAALITLVLGVVVLGVGVYIIDKAENSLLKYETTHIKKDK